MTGDNAGDGSLKRARGLIRKRDFAGAIELLRKLLDVSASDADALELLGLSYFLSKDPENARGVFEKLTVQDPKRASGWINLGAVLNQLRDYKKAAEVLRRGLQRDRNNAEAHFNMGVAQKGLRMNTMAIAAYKEAIRCRPEMVQAHLNLGSLYAEMKNQGLAAQSFQNALKHDPTSAKAKQLLEQIQAFQRQARKAGSPFGRLVDETELANRAQDLVVRSLDEDRRAEERELVQNLTKKIRQSARDLVPLLQEDLWQLVHQLQVIVRQGDVRHANPEPHRRLAETIETARELRAVVADGFAELRAHLQK